MSLGCASGGCEKSERAEFANSLGQARAEADCGANQGRGPTLRADGVNVGVQGQHVVPAEAVVAAVETVAAADPEGIGQIVGRGGLQAGIVELVPSQRLAHAVKGVWLHGFQFHVAVALRFLLEGKDCGQDARQG